MMSLIDPNFWKNKKVLVTGHTGFKGGWLSIWLQQLGAEVSGISLAPNTQPSLFELTGLAQTMESYELDIRNADALRHKIKLLAPDIIFHLAAQPLVRQSYAEPIQTFETNVMGSINVLDAVRHCPSVQAVVMVTTDKVYHNRENLQPYRETDRLGGYDPYSASKAAAEIAINSYRNAFASECHAKLVTVRAGNVIGGGDWSADRLLPDAVRAWNQNRTLHIRRPEAVRPWQHVLEPLSGYLRLAQLMCQSPSCIETTYNFGPDIGGNLSVKEMMQLIQLHLPELDVSYGDGDEGPHEAGLLLLDINKAEQQLAWKPVWSVAEAIKYTLSWYKGMMAQQDVLALCLKDIEQYRYMSVE